MKDEIDLALLEKWNESVPRYTSYPPSPHFNLVEEGLYRNHLALLDGKDLPLSLYIHIPFCKSMCLFCACSVVLNRRPERQASYLSSLLLEISLLPFQKKKKVLQLHLGGGTPTSLQEEEIDQLMRALRERFDFSGEISIEIDPRTVVLDEGKKLQKLFEWGFNRVSFGVQDLDPKVQEAVHRRQSEAVTRKTFSLAQNIGFEEINLDLIYGLPFQTVESFALTAEKIASLRPNRIALFSYAKVPWLKPHQKAIREETLPSLKEKFQIYLKAREIFLENGYVAIGMDHFALKTDPMAQAYREGNLTRTFQGYALLPSDDLVGLGMSSIGFVQGAFFQNAKTLEGYQKTLSLGRLPVERGYVLSEEDRIRRWVIESLMCQFQIDKEAFFERFGKRFDLHFAKEAPTLAHLIEEGLLVQDGRRMEATVLGRLFIRNVASRFDAYQKGGRYSKAI